MGSPRTAESELLIRDDGYSRLSILRDGALRDSGRSWRIRGPMVLWGSCSWFLSDPLGVSQLRVSFGVVYYRHVVCVINFSVELLLTFLQLTYTFYL